MKVNTSDRELLAGYKARAEIAEKARDQSIPIKGRMIRTITRADGSIDETVMDNIVVAEGLTHLALLGCTNGNSAFVYLSIGTQTAAHSLGSTQAGIGEVSRKIGATVAGSNEVMIIVGTWAGAADSISSLDLRTGAVFNHASSGSGVMLNAVNSVATILADSDFLRLQAEIQIGSHNL